MTKIEFMSRLNDALSSLPQQERTEILNDYEEHFRIGAEMGKSEAEIAGALGSPEELGASYVEGEPIEPPIHEVPQSPFSHPEQQVSSHSAGYRTEDFHFPWDAPRAPQPPHMEEDAPQAEYYQADPADQTSNYGAPNYETPNYDYNGGYPPPPEPNGYDYANQNVGYPPPYYGPRQSRTPGEQAGYTVLFVLLTIFIVLPVGVSLALALGGVILGLGVAAVSAAFALLSITPFSTGCLLLGLAALCLAVSLFLSLISFVGGVIKLFVSYFKMCARVIGGKQKGEVY